MSCLDHNSLFFYKFEDNETKLVSVLLEFIATKNKKNKHHFFWLTIENIKRIQ